MRDGGVLSSLFTITPNRKSLSTRRGGGVESQRKRTTQLAVLALRGSLGLAAICILYLLRYSLTNNTSLELSSRPRPDTCQFRTYPPKRYYGLWNKEQPDFLTTQTTYIFGQAPQLLPSSAQKLCVDQSEWYHPPSNNNNKNNKQLRTKNAPLPFADGTNPSLLKLPNEHLSDDINSLFPPEAKFLATVCMTDSQCSWKDSPQEILEYRISTDTKPSTLRTVLLVLDAQFHTLEEMTIQTLIDAQYGKRKHPKSKIAPKDTLQADGSKNNYPHKTFPLDDARLFTHAQQIWLSFRDGPNFGYETQVLVPLHVDVEAGGQLQATLQASETETLCCGRNMALLDPTHHHHHDDDGKVVLRLQALTWVDPVTVVDVELRRQADNKNNKEEPARRNLVEEAPPLSSSTDRKTSHIHRTNGNMIHLPETHEYLGIAHFHRPPGRGAPNNEYARFGHHYTHALFTISDTPPYRLQRISPELVFPSQQRQQTAKKKKSPDAEIIQFWSGLEWGPTTTTDRQAPQLAIAYGINDCEAAATYVDFATVQALLRVVPEGQQVVDLMAPLSKDPPKKWKVF